MAFGAASGAGRARRPPPPPRPSSPPARAYPFPPRSRRGAHPPPLPPPPPASSAIAAITSVSAGTPATTATPPPPPRAPRVLPPEELGGRRRGAPPPPLPRRDRVSAVARDAGGGHPRRPRAHRARRLGCGRGPARRGAATDRGRRPCGGGRGRRGVGRRGCAPPTRAWRAGVAAAEYAVALTGALARGTWRWPAPLSKTVPRTGRRRWVRRRPARRSAPSAMAARGGGWRRGRACPRAATLGAAVVWADAARTPPPRAAPTAAPPRCSMTRSRRPTLAPAPCPLVGGPRHGVDGRRGSGCARGARASLMARPRGGLGRRGRRAHPPSRRALSRGAPPPSAARQRRRAPTHAPHWRQRRRTRGCSPPRTSDRRRPPHGRRGGGGGSGGGGAVGGAGGARPIARLVAGGGGAAGAAATAPAGALGEHVGHPVGRLAGWGRGGGGDRGLPTSHTTADAAGRHAAGRGGGRGGAPRGRAARGARPGGVWRAGEATATGGSPTWTRRDARGQSSAHCRARVRVAGRGPWRAARRGPSPAAP
ncbi:hypothetical protein BU14_0027s0054 [Porphyra umbilicalis]|uniref:Uncharacterized protein n=1 Tax=Porphyra umbilicalis TaxID=2786 RepID=A0A1X6PJY8_PORUM|nr:hypothetical protein BU14_0027s0054 [Porphyra umbilicalis]|eukprot:OSX81028.1 hypothetical protein BU14_0027s0054 [Porphyra umbilicalis]